MTACKETTHVQLENRQAEDQAEDLILRTSDKAEFTIYVSLLYKSQDSDREEMEL